MMNPPKETKLLPLSFRVDPDLLETFKTHCAETKTTRSEAFREIFNEYIVSLKQQQHETNDLKRS